MKHFLVIVSSAAIKRNTWLHPYDVYQIKKNNLIPIGRSHYHYGTCVRTHAMKFLAENKIIPSAYKDVSSYYLSYKNDSDKKISIDVIITEDLPVKKFEPYLF